MDKEIFKADFTHIYNTNYWGGSVSKSGGGSDLEQTQKLTQLLKGFLTENNISSVVDLGCGDCAWIIDAIPGIRKYIGVDVVTEVIEQNRYKHPEPKLQFVEADSTRYTFSKVDVVICRDILCHLPYEDALRLIENVKQSRSTWFIATHFIDINRRNPDTLGELCTFSWYPPVMTRPPFNFPEPDRVLEEVDPRMWELPGVVKDKALGIWKVERLLCLD